ncbi:MAG: tRNA (adenine-N1)-methyltransferase [Anaerolineae bacterium]
MRLAQEGDLVLIVAVERDRRSFVRRLVRGGKLDTHRGELAFDDLIGQPLGAQVETHLGHHYYMLTPTTDDLVRTLRRESQIIFPKDSGYIIMKLGIVPGSQVLEAGTGSGGLCLALASQVGDGGRVYSYDIRPDLQEIARKNLARVGLDGRVTFKIRDAHEGFDETDLDALFLDTREPWELLDQARAALRGSGMLGAIVPTANQLVAMLRALNAHPYYGFVEAQELMLRPYKTLPDRVRPDERFIGHTGYLIFARAVFPPGTRHAAHESTGAGLAEGQENLR